MSSPEPPFVRRNFNALVADVTLFLLGISFLDVATVLPAIVRDLGGGDTALGWILALRQAALYLPPLLSGYWLQGRRRFLPPLVKMALLGRIFLLPAALAVWTLGRSHPGVALGVFAAAYLISWVGDGAGGVPWTAFIGRAIPPDRRGRLFATVQAFSSVVRLGAGLLIAPLLAGRWLPFPGSAGVLILIAFGFLMLSWGAITLLREPPASPTDEPSAERLPLARYVGRLPALLKRNPNLLRLAVAQVLGLAGAATIPFIVLGARSMDLTPPAALQPLLEKLGNGGAAGVFLLAMIAGQMASAPVWGRLTDRHGPRWSLVGLYALGALAPLCALLGVALGGGMLPFLAAYFFFGAVGDAWSATLNYLLELVHQSGESETDAIALMNVASVPALLLPLLAGALTHGLGLAAPFLGATALVGLACVLVCGLPDTRRAATSPAPTPR